jgi:hypothetical protein
MPLIITLVTLSHHELDKTSCRCEVYFHTNIRFLVVDYIIKGFFSRKKELLLSFSWSRQSLSLPQRL